jgi:hypothetical protein
MLPFPPLYFTNGWNKGLQSFFSTTYFLKVTISTTSLAHYAKGTL